MPKQKVPWFVTFNKHEFDDAYDDRETQQSPTFDRMFREARSWFKKFCKDNGFTDLEIKKNFYEFSGFFRVGEQLWYFCSTDARWGFNKYMYVRTAKHNKDWTGGQNINIVYDENFADKLLSTVKRGW